MKIMLKTNLLISSFALFSLTAFAEKSTQFTVDGTIETTIPIKVKSNNLNTTYDLNALNGFKVIKLMSITPSETMKLKNRKALADSFAAGGENDYSKGITTFDLTSTGSVDLGMNKVPVLDQGAFGTCVTFSTTAALDSLITKKDSTITEDDYDFIDQQCTLELNKGLGNNYWHGANNATEIVIPLKQNGIIKKDNCFGITYPNARATITKSKYKTRSITKYNDKINYKFYDTANLDSIKKALFAGHRVLIGFGLSNIDGNKISVNGFDLIVNKNEPTTGGLWACKQPGDNTNYCPSDASAGHEVIVIGYDDNQQLLKIRNSWGTDPGENGDYYMTYTFFKAMAADMTEVY